MQRADRDSQLRGARLLGSSTRGSLTQKTDLDDLYRFNVSNRSRINLQLTGLPRRTNANIEVYRLTRPFGDVSRSIGSIDFRRLRGNQRRGNLQLVAASRQGGNRNELIDTVLDSGDYIVRVTQRQGNPTYQLSLSNTPIEQPAPPAPAPAPPTDSTPPSAPIPPAAPPPTQPAPIPLTIPTSGSVVGAVNDAAQETVYSFSINTQGDYLFNLSGLSGNADLQIRAADQRTVIRTSDKPGANPEQFIQTMTPGNYFVRVYQNTPGVDTSYQLRVNPLTDAVGNEQSTATPIVGLSTTTLTRRNYVGAGSSSPADYYEFETPTGGSQFLTVEMVDLFDDLDIELYEKPADPSAAPNDADIILFRRPGASAETFGGTVSGGKTFILKVLPGKVLPGEEPTDGSTYRLNLRLNPTQSRPSVSRDIAFGTASSGVANLTAVGGFAYFTADDGTSNALWASDGTLDGTRKLGEFDTIGEFVSVNNTLYFTADNGTSGLELWRSDGTEAGTRIVTDKLPGIDSFNPSNFAVVNNRLYFFAQPIAFAGSINLFYLDAADTSSDPIKAVVDTTNNANFNPLSFSDSQLVAVGNTLYFTGNRLAGSGGAATGKELLRIQIANASTTISAIDIYPGGDSSNPQFLTKVGNSLFVQATAPLNDSPSVQTELFRISEDGAVTPFNLPSSPANSNPSNLLEINGTLYFTARGGDGVNSFGNELWALQNAEIASGTQVPVLVSNINPGSGSSSPSNFVNLNGTLYFMADDGAGRSLWRTTSTTTAGQTTISAEKVSNSRLNGITNIRNLTGVGEGSSARLYFVATQNEGQPDADTEIWFTNGTAAETGFFNLNAIGSSDPRQLTNINGRLFFIASTDERGTELWSFSGVPVP